MTGTNPLQVQTKLAGNGQALFNDALWQDNSLTGSVYHASLGAIIKDLG